MKAVMVTTKENAKFLLDELGDEIAKEDIVIKIIPEEEFAWMTNKKASLEIDISDEDFLALSRIAHERDITFNHLVNDVIREKMEEMDDETRSNSGDEEGKES